MHRRNRLSQVKNLLPIAGYICTILPSQIYGDVREPLMSYKNFILSYSILCCFILLPYLILPYSIISYPILSRPILSYPTLSYPILSDSILSCPILSYHILPSLLLSFLIFVTLSIFPILCPLDYFFLLSFLFLFYLQLFHCAGSMPSKRYLKD